MATLSTTMGTNDSGYAGWAPNANKAQVFMIKGRLGSKFYLNDSPYPITIVNAFSEGDGYWTQDFKGDFDIKKVRVIAPSAIKNLTYNVTITTA